MARQPELLDHWHEQAQEGTLTLLCGCQDADRCHRTLLKELLEEG